MTRVPGETKFKHNGELAEVVIYCPQTGLLQAQMLAKLTSGALTEHIKKDPEYNGVWRDESAIGQIALAAHKLRRMDALIKGGADESRIMAEAVDGLNYVAFGIRQVPTFRM